MEEETGQVCLLNHHHLKPRLGLLAITTKSVCGAQPAPNVEEPDEYSHLPIYGRTVRSLNNPPFGERIAPHLLTVLDRFSKHVTSTQTTTASASLPLEISSWVARDSAPTTHPHQAPHQEKLLTQTGIFLQPRTPAKLLASFTVPRLFRVVPKFRRLLYQELERRRTVRCEKAILLMVHLVACSTVY